MRSIIVRLVGLLLALVPLALIVRHLWLHGHEKHGKDESTVIISFIAMGIFSVPGAYLAIKGAGTSPPNGFRSRCVAQIVLGVGMLLLWGIVMVIGNYLTWLLGFMFVWYGALAVAAVCITLGGLSLISNRELLTEMSELNLWGKPPETK